VAVPSLVIFAAAAVLLTLSTGLTGVQGPLAARAESLKPSQIELNAEDRYRIGERKNVLRDLEENPVTGLGLAVPWTARFPLSVDRPGSREYVHFTALWWWLKLGMLGLIAYLWLMAAGAWAAYRVWREQEDAWLRLAGLGALGGLIGLALVEATAAFTGVTERFTVMIGSVLGLLSAALLDARRRTDVGGSRRAPPQSSNRAAGPEPRTPVGA
jgi:hypothetical protein